MLSYLFRNIVQPTLRNNRNVQVPLLDNGQLRFFSRSIPTNLKYHLPSFPVDVISMPMSLNKLNEDMLNKLPLKSGAAYVRSPDGLGFISGYNTGERYMKPIWMEEEELKSFDEMIKSTNEARTLSKKEMEQAIEMTRYNPPFSSIPSPDHWKKSMPLPVLIWRSASPLKDKFKIKDNESYLIRSLVGLHFVSRFGIIVPIDLDEATLKLFDDTMKPQYGNRQLSKREMKKVKSITKLSDHAGYPSDADLPADLVWMENPPTQDTLDHLPLKSNGGYIRSRNGLCFVNKAWRDITLLNLTEAELKRFDETMKPMNEPRTLSGEEIDQTESITKYCPKVLRLTREESMQFFKEMNEFHEKVDKEKHAPGSTWSYY